MLIKNSVMVGLNVVNVIAIKIFAASISNPSAIEHTSVMYYKTCLIYCENMSTCIIDFVRSDMFKDK